MATKQTPEEPEKDVRPTLGEAQPSGSEPIPNGADTTATDSPATDLVSFPANAVLSQDELQVLSELLDAGIKNVGLQAFTNNRGLMIHNIVAKLGQQAIASGIQPSTEENKSA